MCITIPKTIKAVLFDLEGIALELGNPNRKEVHRLFAPHLDELSSRGYRIIFVSRTGESNSDTYEELFSHLHGAELLKCKFSPDSSDQRIAFLAERLHEIGLSPSEAFYFRYCESACRQTASVLHAKLDNAGFSHYGFGRVTHDDPDKHGMRTKIAWVLRFEIYADNAVSKAARLEPAEQNLAGQMIGLLAQRLTDLENNNPDDWEDHIEAMIWDRARELGQNHSNLSDVEKERIRNDFGLFAEYSYERQSTAAKHAKINHQYMGAFEDAVATLEYWDVVQLISGSFYEMNYDASDLYAGKVAGLPGDNQFGLTRAVGSFFSMQGQVNWGYWDVEKPRRHEIPVSQEVKVGFENAGLIRKTSEGYVWTDKSEPIFAYFGLYRVAEAEVAATFEYLCGLRSVKEK